jgi:hypothetical protein
MRIREADGSDSYVIQTTREDGGVPTRISTIPRGGDVVALEPNEAWQDDFLLTQRYDMTLPGMYAVPIGKQHGVSADPAPSHILATLSKVTVTH